MGFCCLVGCGREADDEAARLGAADVEVRPYGNDDGRGAELGCQTWSTRDVLLTACVPRLLVVRLPATLVGEMPFRTGTGIPRGETLAGDVRLGACGLTGETTGRGIFDPRAAAGDVSPEGVLGDGVSALLSSSHLS